MAPCSVEIRTSHRSPPIRRADALQKEPRSWLTFWIFCVLLNCSNVNLPTHKTCKVTLLYKIKIHLNSRKALLLATGLKFSSCSIFQIRLSDTKGNLKNRKKYIKES